MAKLMMESKPDGVLVEFPADWYVTERWTFDRSSDQYIIAKDNKLTGK